jgi:hypothetical protein
MVARPSGWGLTGIVTSRSTRLLDVMKTVVATFLAILISGGVRASQADEAASAEDDVHEVVLRQLITERYAAIYCVNTSNPDRDVRLGRRLSTSAISVIPASECGTEDRGLGMSLVIETRSGTNAHMLLLNKYKRVAEAEAQLTGPAAQLGR